MSKILLSVLCIPVLLLAAADQPSWQTKEIADWTPDDAHQVLTDSPWAKSVTPKIIRSSSNEGSGNRGNIGINGIPGVGGMGRRGMRNGTQNNTQTNTAGSTASGAPPTLTVRWESALPVQAAEMKARNLNAPSADEDHYAVAVYGVPTHMLNSDSGSIEDQLKNQAEIKREGKKDLKPSSVEVIPRDDGTVVVYFFPRSKEITRQDKQIDFSAQIGRLEFSAPFNVQEMSYQGKLAL